MNIAVIGYGYWGPNLVRNFSKISNVKYIVEIDEKRKESAILQYPNINVISDYNSVLEDKEIEGIVIATPVSSHFELAKKALENNKNVLVEKPITKEIKEAEELIKLSEIKKKVLMVDHTFLYSEPVRRIKHYIESGEIGEILTISIDRLNLGLFQKDINVISDLCPHDISILNFLLKEKVILVNAVGTEHIQKGIVDDAHVFIKYENNISVSIHVSWLDPVKVRRFSVVGSKKMILYDDVEPLDKIKLFDKSVLKTKNGLPVHPYYSNMEEFQLAYKHGDTLIPKLDLKEPLFVMANDFIDSIKNNKKPISDGYSGLNVLKIIEAAQKSLINNGKPVFLGEKNAN